MIESVYQGFRERIYGLFHATRFILLALIFSFTSIKAQQYEVRLAWSAQPETFNLINGKTISQPDFTHAVHQQKYGLLPSFSQVTPAITGGKVTVQLISPVYAAAGPVDNSSLKYIKTTPEVIGQIAYYHKKPRLYLSVLPFRKNPSTGAIEKLVSFTLKATVIPQNNEKSLHSYAANSVLANGTWYKISVTADGIYKIDYNFIKNTLGINPSSVNLNTLAIFGNGGGMLSDIAGTPRPDDLTENPTMLVNVDGGSTFGKDDYLLFYGQMPDAWVYDSVSQTFSHQKNLYTNATYYFLTIDAGTGKRVQTTSTALIPNKTITVFDEHAYHDSDIVSLLQSGKEWLGEEMTSFSTTQSFSFNFPNIVTSTPVKVNSMLGISVYNTYSSTTLSVNGQAVFSQNDGGISTANNDYPDVYTPNDSIGIYHASSSQLNVTYTFSPQSDPSGTAACYIDWIELTGQRQLTLAGNAMTFRSIASTSSPACNFVVGGASSSTLVWDVTNIGSISQMQTTLNGSNLSYNAATTQLQEFIAFNNSSANFGNPDYVGTVPNQNLHATGQPNMVIVAYDDFLTAANDLASYHRTNDNLTVSVAPLSQVYNEFGSGKPDISAIRDFIKMMYDRGGNDTTKWPHYLLLLGDGSFDPKGRTANADNFINTYQSYDSYEQIYSYTSDDFFGLLDDGDGGDVGNGIQYLETGIGRLTADDETSAQAMANKIMNYAKLKPGCTTCAMANTNNSWRNVLSFVADYPYQGDVDFEINSEQLAESTRASYPVYNFSKIYTDAYKLTPTPAGDRFPDANAAILNQINAGTLLMNWVGHGDEVTWSNGRIFTFSMINSLENQYLPLFITATCDFSRYDGPSITGGESLLSNANGGGIALISTVRLVYESSNTTIDNAVFEYLFAPINGLYPTLGQITQYSKNTAVSADAVNTRKFTLLGDPALTLDYPRYNIITDSVDHKLITAPHDTLKALTRITISGHLTDNNNNKLTTFSGTVYPEVYDKISNLQTLNNNDYGSVEPFVEYTSLLFKGTASITAGNFSFSFIVPKDINYQYGPGRISYYADNGVSLTANGYSNAIIVGGSSGTAHASTTGPKMTLYMNDANFAYGGITNASPLLLVELQDSGGINTTGNGVGHNLTAILDNNYQSPIILNNYYQSALNNFTQGEVRYPFSDLAGGTHTIQVKAWDIYDNSAEATTEFIVTNTAQLALNHVYNYPNPFTTHTEFMFEDNTPCDLLNINIQIYSVSGKLVKSISQQVQSTGYRVDGIVWDGLDDFGDPIGKGVYIYKLSVKDQTTGNTAHKFEKLVLLR